MASTLGWLAIVAGVAILSAAITRILAGRARPPMAPPRRTSRPMSEVLVERDGQPPVYYAAPVERRLTRIAR